jgi:hypothetical protein
MSGYKVWGIGEIVEAGDFQSYIQNQAVMKFADSAARSAALGTAVANGMVSYLVSTGTLEYYNGTIWTAVSNPGDITAVTAGTGLSGGGTSGAVTLNVNYAAVGSAVLASPTITGTATIAAGTVTGNLGVGGTVIAATGTVSGNLTVGGDLRDTNWTASRVLTTSAGTVAVTDAITTTELSYLSGVTSNIQTQINSLGGGGTVTSITAAYTAVAADANDTLYSSGTAAITITVPDVLAIGQRIDIWRNAGGTVTIAAGTGVTDWAGAGTAGTAVTFKIDQTYNAATVQKVAANTYRVVGKITV